MAQPRYSLPSAPTAIPRQVSSPLRPSNLSASRPGSSTPTFGSGIPPPGIFASPSPPTPSRLPVGAGHRMQPFSYPGAESRPGSVGVGGRARVESAAEETMREWSFFGVDITISNVHALSIDDPPVPPTASSGDLGRRPPSALSTSEVFTTSFGGDRWKLEILRPAAPAPTLSLYLSCNLLETSFSASTIPTTLMFGIREPKEQVGKREGRDGWIWRVWENEWCFGAGAEYWECHTFPSLNALLQNSRIAALDSFVLSIQIQSPPAQSMIPQIQELHHVPRDLLAGLKTLLDNEATADVLFYMHERHPSLPGAMDADISNPSTAPEEVQRYRKRTIYAHSAILEARSTYFADMLSAGWAETSGEGRVKNVVRIEDFDFVTVYWLLHYLYTNEITFQHTEDARAQHPSDDLPPGWLASPSQLNWSWMPLAAFVLPLSHPHPTASSSSLPSDRLADIAESSSSLPRSKRSSTTSSSLAGKRRPETPDPPSPTRASLAAGRISPLQGGRVSPTIARSRRYPSGTEEVDPHGHPVAVTEPASAFAIYRIAHRYSLHALAAHALAQVVQSLTPKTAFPLLLATHLWPELHAEIKGYALAHFYEVCAEPELARCYAEVGEGMWENGGAVLLDWTLNLTPAWT